MLLSDLRGSHFWTPAYNLGNLWRWLMLPRRVESSTIRLSEVNCIGRISFVVPPVSFAAGKRIVILLLKEGRSARRVVVRGRVWTASLGERGLLCP